MLSSIESAFDKPCVPLAGGYDSGYQTVAAGTPVNAGGLPTTTITVNSLDPMWFYDGAPNQCHLGGVL